MDHAPIEIEPGDVALDDYAAIIDIREGGPSERAIVGSIPIDRKDLDAIERLIPSPDARILVYCGIGVASLDVARRLSERGFGGVVSLAGGMRRWESEGRAVVNPGNRTVDRYDRHIRLDGIGAEGQSRIRDASVLVVGAGGLGSPVIQYLTAAGVGTLGVVDGDRVDATNLHRQVLFNDAMVGMRKVDAVPAAVRDLNPDVAVIPVDTWFDETNADELVDGYDLVIDASDNYATRLAVNDACVSAGIPFVHGAAIRWEGLVAAFDPRIGPCYRCLFPRLPGSEAACSDVGVLGPVTGVVGSLMAVEALKHITLSPDRSIDRLITYDARSMRFDSLRIRRSDRCPLGHERT